MPLQQTHQNLGGLIGAALGIGNAVPDALELTEEAWPWLSLAQSHGEVVIAQRQPPACAVGDVVAEDIDHVAVGRVVRFHAGREHAEAAVNTLRADAAMLLLCLSAARM